MTVQERKAAQASLNLIYDVSTIGLTLGNNQARTGIYRVVSEILNELKKINSLHIEYSHTDYLYDISALEKHLGKKIHNKAKYKLIPSVFGRGKGFLQKLYNHFGLDEILYDEEIFKEADIFHTPDRKIPTVLKGYSNLARVITIYDLIPIKFSQYHTLREGLEEIIASIGKDYAICISDFTRNDLLEYNRSIDPGKVFVSYLAADREKFYPCDNEEKKREVQKKYNLPDNYFLSLCTLEPRKNLIRLIRCFIRFIEQQNIDDLKLVLVGTKGWNFESTFDETFGSHKHRDKIIVTGRIPDADLASVYSHAHSFYYISLYEGFGLPPLEAMQCGVPTVTSNVTSLPEVVGDGGIMTDPKDEDEICETMYQLYSNESIKNHYITQGLEQAGKFSWEKTASEHLEIYQKILANR